MKVEERLAAALGQKMRGEEKKARAGEMGKKMF